MSMVTEVQILNPIKNIVKAKGGIDTCNKHIHGLSLSRTENSMADRKESTIYTLHRSYTYVLDRQFNGRQKRVNYLHTTQKSYIRAGQTI